MVNGISSIGFGSQQICPQKTKSLGFGRFDDGKKLRTTYESGISEKRTPEPTFEEQVLFNQQKMLGMLEKIEANTDRSPRAQFC